MNRKNAPYFCMWQERWRPFVSNKLLTIHFSPQYFEKLRRELESAGYEVTIAWDDVWYSEPVGYFFISDCLKGECFVFLDMNGPWMKT